MNHVLGHPKSITLMLT